MEKMETTQTQRSVVQSKPVTWYRSPQVIDDGCCAGPAPMRSYSFSFFDRETNQRLQSPKAYFNDETGDYDKSPEFLALEEKCIRQLEASRAEDSKYFTRPSKPIDWSEIRALIKKDHHHETAALA